MVHARTPGGLYTKISKLNNEKSFIYSFFSACQILRHFSSAQCWPCAPKPHTKFPVSVGGSSIFGWDSGAPFSHASTTTHWGKYSARNFLFSNPLHIIIVPCAICDFTSSFVSCFVFGCSLCPWHMRNLFFVLSASSHSSVFTFNITCINFTIGLSYWITQTSLGCHFPQHTKHSRSAITTVMLQRTRVASPQAKEREMYT